MDARVASTVGTRIMTISPASCYSGQTRQSLGR
jgi:hypothetical protein